MKEFQVFNKRTDRFVLFQQKKGKAPKIVNTKQKNPTQPFKGVKIK